MKNCDKCSLPIRGKMLSPNFYDISICVRCAPMIGDKEEAKLRSLIRGKKAKTEKPVSSRVARPRAPRGFWNFEKSVKAANDSGSIAAMIEKYPGATAWVYQNKMATKVFSSAKIYAEMHGKCVYLWRAGIIDKSGRHLVKVGMTSENIGAARIFAVSRPYGFTPDIVFVSPATRKAVEIERALLSIGIPAEMDYRDGYTEFRWMDDCEIDRCKLIACET